MTEPTNETELTEKLLKIVDLKACPFHKKTFSHGCTQCRLAKILQKQYEQMYRLISEESKRAQIEMANFAIAQLPKYFGSSDVSYTVKKTIKEYAQSLGLSIKE